MFFPVGEKPPTILKWRILTTTSDLERVSAVALPKLPISISNTDLKVASDTKFCPGLGEETLTSGQLHSCVRIEENQVQILVQKTFWFH